MVAPPRASVCIPTCEGERYVAAAVESVLAQTLGDLEVHVVDDCSADRTMEIVASYRDPRLHLHRNVVRLGIAGNWNRCLELARGEFFCLFHQDDEMLPGNLELKVRMLEADPSIGLVHSSVEFLAAPDAPPGSGQWIEDATEDFVVDGSRYFRTMILSGNRICAPAVVARRDALVQAGGFSEDLGFALDYELWLKACVKWRVGFLDRPLVRYRWHQGNASHAYRFERALKETVTAATRALAFYGAAGADDDELSLLREALATVNRQRRWAAELEKAKDWWAEQHISGKRRAEQQEGVIRELRGWIGELETANGWWAEQYRTWRRLAEEREDLILELRGWIAELEVAKAWLARQESNWKGLAEQREGEILELRGWVEKLEKARHQD